jgi:tubulin-specific chaperone A
MLMTGNVVGATQAFRVMTATMMTTPWFYYRRNSCYRVAYVMFSDNAKQAETAQSFLNKTLNETEAIVNQQTASMKTLCLL